MLLAAVTLAGCAGQSIDWPDADQVSMRAQRECSVLTATGGWDPGVCRDYFTSGYQAERDAIADGAPRDRATLEAAAQAAPHEIGREAYLAGAKYAVEASAAVH